MQKMAFFAQKLQHVCRVSGAKMLGFGKALQSLAARIRRRLNPFWIHLCYFLSVSFIGFLLLKVLNPKTSSFSPKDLDMFFMSVSAVTVSSMSTVQIEVFSNSQLIFMTILMLLGTEVFTSMLGLRFSKTKLGKYDSRVNVLSINNPVGQIELSMITGSDLENEGPITFDKIDRDLKSNSLRFLGYVVLGYLLVFLVGGSISVMLYLSLVPSASDVLKNKGIQLQTFSIFTVVSTFASCGFIPTNENMIVFRNNPGLLLLLLPQVLFGNTLYPSCLRFAIWLSGKITKKEEFQYMLKYTREMGYHHLLPSRHSLMLVFTVFGFILVQFVLFCSMEWNSGAMDGMSVYQKAIGVLFQVVNTRHTGESIVDLSIISPAVLVLFVFMMYLPPYTSFLPLKENDEQFDRISEQRKKHRRHSLENVGFSQLSYLVIFVMLVCISEREKMKNDPVNFSIFNIVLEVVSAYGNVGFSTGYSCKRQINPDGKCRDAWYGFSGRWSNGGKMILVLVMFFGRLKKFNMGGGKAWKLM